MEAIIFDIDNERFIKQAAGFCTAIDQYTEILCVNTGEVDSLKDDINMAVYLDSNQLTLPVSFIRYNMNELRNRLVDICNACRRSKQYTRLIGIDLGLESEKPERNYFAENWGKLFDEILYTSPGASVKEHA
jgi:hypothetical protein